jgi:hypothetical protein
MIPTFNRPIYEGIFANICSLFPSHNWKQTQQHGSRKYADLTISGAM